MASVLGFEAKAYYNTGSYGSPTWNEIINIKDLSMSLEKGKADVTTRGNTGWRANRGTLKDATVTWAMVHDTADADYIVMRNAWLNGTALDMLFLDGPIGTVGSKGFRMTCEIFKFEQTENLEEAVMNNVEAGPTYSANPPTDYTVS